MKAQLWSYDLKTAEVFDVRNIIISDDYDDDPYGEFVGFAVGSNQRIVTDESLFLTIT